MCVAADGFGNVFISGFTSGALQDGYPTNGSNDVFLRKYSSAGTILWTRQLGTGLDDIANEITTDQLGNVFVTGQTSGLLGGPSAGDRDTFLVKYDPSGNLTWTRQIGTSSVDDGYGTSADGLGNIFIAGRTAGALAAPLHGEIDAFVAKFADVPEPSTAVIALVAGALLLYPSRSRHKGRVALTL